MHGCMNQRLTPVTITLLTIPPLMWAANAIVGRLVVDLVPPITLNFLRWFVALLIVLPFGWRLLRPSGPVWPRIGRYAVLGLLGVGLYNALQYMAVKTSTPINVTLVGSSMPAFMLAVGALFFGQRATRRQLLGAALSALGVLVVLSHGHLERLAQVQFVIGDLFMLLATLGWAVYSWLLTRPGDPEEIRQHWAGILMAQLAPGVLWCVLFAAAEGAWTTQPVVWGWPLVAAILFVAIGPALIAYRCWGLGVQRVGPSVAGFFANLSPLFAALFSAAFLGEPPQLHHAIAFVLIVGGIVVSSRR